MGDFRFEYLIPITALLIPIVAILTAHQRKMAEMMAEQHRAMMDLESRRMSAANAAPSVDVNAQYELQTMRDRLAQMEAKLAASEHQRTNV